MTAIIPAVSSNLSADNFSSATLEKAEKSAEFFPLYIEQIMNNNINSMFSFMANPLAEDANGSTGSPVFGLSDSYGSDPLAALGNFSGSIASDPLSSLFSNQGVGTDFSFLGSSSAINSVKVQETFNELLSYSNLTEHKKWLGQNITYLDPADGVTKTGLVSRIDIENVAKPLFYVDDLKLTIDDIKELNV